MFSLRNLDESVLCDIEEFAREELAELLAAEYMLMDSKLDELDNVVFFGIFAAKPSQFRFLPGERFSMMEMCDYVKSIIGKKDIFADLKTEKTSRINTIQLPIGTFFGRKITKMNTPIPLTTSQLRESLIPKMKNLILVVKPKHCIDT